MHHVQFTGNLLNRPFLWQETLYSGLFIVSSCTDALVPRSGASPKAKVAFYNYTEGLEELLEGFMICDYVHKTRSYYFTTCILNSFRINYLRK